MLSSTNLSGWAGAIIDSMELSGVTTGSVVSWLENNVGSLNLAIRESYGFSGSSGILPEMNINAMAIYSKMYECYYLAREGRRASQLGYSDWLEINGQDQGLIRKVSKSELSKNFISMCKDCNSNLSKMVSWYVNDGGNGSGSSRMPSQVIGDQAFSCSIPESYLNSYNCFNE